MSQATWHLVYTGYEEMESIGTEVQCVEILLTSSEEGDALSEAREKWGKIVADANASWENQKRTWMHPPSGPFHGVTPNPHVIRKIPLE